MLLVCLPAGGGERARQVHNCGAAGAVLRSSGRPGKCRISEPCLLLRCHLACLPAPSLIIHHSRQRSACPTCPHVRAAASALPPCLLLPQVLIDGLSVQKLGLKYLRSQIGLVGQEPIMFRWARSCMAWSPGYRAMRAGGKGVALPAGLPACPHAGRQACGQQQHAGCHTTIAKQRPKLFRCLCACVCLCLCLPAALPSWRTSASATRVPPCPRYAAQSGACAAQY